jgi:3-deoxy-D-manno-octulosonic-acid transferase
MMQSEEDAQRIRSIGAPPERVVVTGNIKFEKNTNAEDAGEKAVHNLEEGFCHDSEGSLIVAGSTHEGEEQILLEALQRVRRIRGLDSTRRLIAPRHPERFEEVAAIVQHYGFKLRRRTAVSEGPAEVLLLDTLGELAAVYRLATVVFVGGTLDRRGGHSIMEPALYSKAIVVGPSMENFRQIMEEFRAQGGVRQIGAGQEDRRLQAEQLAQVFTALLQNPQEREALGRAALSILEKNRGAARITAERIAAIFEENQGRPTRLPVFEERKLSQS